MLHILVIEDEPNVSGLIQKCVEETNGELKIIYIFSGKEVPDEITHHHFPDIIVMDVNLLNGSPVEIIQKLRQRYPDIKILMQADREDINLIISAIEAGVSSYFISADTPVHDMISVLETVYDNGAMMTQNVAQGILYRFNTEKPVAAVPDLDMADFHLTDKEEELLSDLAEGLLYKDIATKRNISIFTVKHHIRNIYKKMHVKSRAQAVGLLIRNKNNKS